MRIRSVEPFILHVPLNVDFISDSTHTITHWGVVGTQDRDRGRAGGIWIHWNARASAVGSTRHVPVLPKATHHSSSVRTRAMANVSG